MEAQWNSIISATFLTSLLTRILEINFCKYCICSVYIAKSLSFFCCEAIFIISLRKLIVTSLPPTPLLFIGLLPWTGLQTRFILLSISLTVPVSFWYQDGFQRKDVILYQTIRSLEPYCPWIRYHSSWEERFKTRQYGSGKKSFSRLVDNFKRKVEK